MRRNDSQRLEGDKLQDRILLCIARAHTAIPNKKELVKRLRSMELSRTHKNRITSVFTYLVPTEIYTLRARPSDHNSEKQTGEMAMYPVQGDLLIVMNRNVLKVVTQILMKLLAIYC